MSVRQKDETGIQEVFIFIRLRLCLQLYGLFKGQGPVGVQPHIFLVCVYQYVFVYYCVVQS